MLHVNRNSNKPIWQQLLDQAIHHITSGDWRPGERLLPSRELAEHIGVSRSTIQIVYDELQSRGYTVTSRRGGTRINEAISQEALPSLPANDECFMPLATPTSPKLSIASPALPSIPDEVRPLPVWYSGLQPRLATIDLNPFEPYIDDTLLHSWRQSFVHATKTAEQSLWGYGSPYGHEQLREQIQHYLSMERGIHVDSEQILLTSGAPHSIDLIAQALLHKGDKVAVEDPGFPVSWRTMKHRQMQVQSVTVDGQGIDVEQIADDAKLIFVTPSHQCAVGSILSVARRQQLLQKAISQKAWIVEDDYDSEFRYRGEPLPSLFSQLPSHTLYLCSFSKMIAPGIRLSAIVGPSDAIAQLAKYQMLIYRQPPVMEQLALYHYIKQGHFLRHMRRTRNIYRKRHEAMTRAITTHGLNQRFVLRGSETGLYMLLEAKEGYNEAKLARLALKQDVRLYPLSAYCLDSPRRGFIMGFAKVDEEQIEKGIARIASIPCLYE